MFNLQWLKINFLFLGVTIMANLYFMTQADGTDQSGLFLNETLQTRAAPGGSMTITTGSDKCGSYQSDGAPTYSSSANFTAGVVNEVITAVVNSNDYRKDRVHSIWVPGSKPSPQVKISNATRYYENVLDDGTCTEDGLTFYKWVATI
jgi:hypothetical protein